MLRTSLRVLIWSYLFLLIFEGVFRKWVFPDQSNIFLIIRDPVVLLIYGLAMADRRFPFHAGTLGTAALALVALVFSFFTAATQVVVLLYGFKAAFLHLPLIWVLPEVFTKKDMVWVERCVFALAPVMAVLMAIQFRASPDSIWNAGPGGTLEAQMEGALGRIRPPGLFSFITGAAQFCGLLSAFLLGAALRIHSRPRWWILGGLTVCLLLCIAVSISRMLVIMTVAPLFMLGFMIRARPELVVRMLALLCLAFGAFLVASGMDVFEEGTEAFQSRLGRTGEYHASWYERAGNVVERMLSEPLWAWWAAGDAPLLGHGLGAGTNVAAAALSGRLQFLLAEGEWVRMVLELGPLLGIPYLLFRTGAGLLLFVPAWRAARQGEGLPLFLWANAFPLIAVGQWGQSTTLGFSVVLGGLVLASAKVALDGDGMDEASQLPPSGEADETIPPPRIRTRMPAPAVPAMGSLSRRDPHPAPEPPPAAGELESSVPPPRFHLRRRTSTPREDRS